MNVLHGDVHNVHGEIKWYGGIGFVNATVGLSGNSWSAECGLREFPDLELTSKIRELAAQHIDAIWVIGRIKAVFGSWVKLNEGEKSIINEGFAACFKETGVSIPFVLHDYYLSATFLFGDTLADSPIKRSIAHSFYSILLEEPYKLADFEFRKDHAGADHWMVGGVIHGQVQFDRIHN